MSDASAAVAQPPACEENLAMPTSKLSACQDCGSKIERLERVNAELSNALNNYVGVADRKFAELSDKLDNYIQRAGGTVVALQVAEPLGQVLALQQPDDVGGAVLQGQGPSSKAEDEGEVSALKAQLEFWRAQACQNSKASQAAAAELRSSQAAAEVAAAAAAQLSARTAELQQTQELLREVTEEKEGTQATIADLQRRLLEETRGALRGQEEGGDVVPSKIAEMERQVQNTRRLLKQHSKARHETEARAAAAEQALAEKGADMLAVVAELHQAREVLRVMSESRDKEGNTPLLIAAFRGHLETARLIVENGADVNAVNKNGWTPLVAAAERGHLDIVRLLVARNADINARSKVGLVGKAALECARRGGHSEIVRFLAQAARHGALGAPPASLAAPTAVTVVSAHGCNYYGRTVATACTCGQACGLPPGVACFDLPASCAVQVVACTPLLHKKFWRLINIVAGLAPLIVQSGCGQTLQNSLIMFGVNESFSGFGRWLRASGKECAICRWCDESASFSMRTALVTTGRIWQMHVADCLPVCPRLASSDGFPTHALVTVSDKHIEEHQAMATCRWRHASCVMQVIGSPMALHDRATLKQMAVTGIGVQVLKAQYCGRSALIMYAGRTCRAFPLASG
eukprot:jgi/Mesvir1/10594/Mv16596-RA.1